MNANLAAKQYEHFTPEERFRLVLAAGARGDKEEQTRLISAGKNIRLSMSDHAPYAQAFDKLALAVFIALLEQAASYLEAFHRADDANFIGTAETEEADVAEQREEDLGEEADATADADEESAWSRCLDIAFAAGYVLRAKTDGWKLFCERLTIPPFVLWEGMPGFERLQRALRLTEGHDNLPGAAFVADGMLRWLNRIRPEGEPELTRIGLTAEAVADEAEEMYREWVRQGGG
jgi:hypothetical protein